MDRLRGHRAPQSLVLVDIHSLDDTQLQAKALPDRDTLLRVLHLRRANGLWLRGADANIAAWEHTRFERYWSVLRWPVIAPVVDLAYQLWARWRYRRLYAGRCNG